MSTPTTHDPVVILDAAGARQYHDAHKHWVISIPRQNDRPSVQWAIAKLEESGGERAFVVWRKQ